ncbi:DNA repair-scaffolding protein [Spea bombifrons]|uniref:DNA repair-scaffolding protein n=1 Tax=Spea bombifrons TaxID=233779 RepID=UPI00234A23B1|nr:DNA repair-scaffolding protein [Spea bombifrons]
MVLPFLATRPENKTLTARRLAQSFVSDDESSVSESFKDPADIVWSSSDSELSDDGSKQLLFQHGSVGCRKAEDDVPQNTDQQNVSDIEFDQKSTTPEAAESEVEISDSSESSSSVVSGDQLQADREPTQAIQIAEYSSDDLEEAPSLVARSNRSLNDERQACPPLERSASDWVRTAQVLLQTPEKAPAKASKTPDDSAKKRKRFLGGGLAERLNRLQNRERSAISFWRHQCDSDCKMPLGDKSGILVLKIMEVHEECSFQVALCQNLTGLPNTEDTLASECSPAEMMKVLFTKQTASQLKGCQHDIIHIHPPWVKLTLRPDNMAVVLNTHFSLRMPGNHNEGKDKKISSLLPERKKVVPLSSVFHINDTESPGEGQPKMYGSRGRPPASSFTVNDSLLDVVETQGASGCRGSCMRVVVQRVYGLPTRDNAAYCLAGSVKPIAPTAGTSQKMDVRLCLLVQDAYGMFSEVHVQSPDCTAADIELYSRRWEGKTCSVSGMKILQRTTKGRAPGLFSLIDSLWPPLVPIKIHGQSQDQGQVQTNLPSPSFCYIFSVHHYEVDDSIRVEEQSSRFYLPPVVHNLEEILQVVGLNQRCSFWVTVIYVRPEVDGEYPPQKDIWMFVTDTSLQETLGCSPRVLPVCVSPSCVLSRGVLWGPLRSQLPCAVSFKDAVKENGKIICVERTVLSLQKPPLSCALGVNELTGPVILDQLDSTTEANSLCSVKGIVVGVNERAAFSWPVCDGCGSSRLQLSAEDGGLNKYFCSSCSRDINSPIIKMQLEVFLRSEQVPGCKVRLKLLQGTISFLLSFCDSELGRYDVNGIIGKEVGPLNCYVQTSAVRPENTLALEEICLRSAGS